MNAIKQTGEMFLTKEQIIRNTISILSTKYNFDKNEAYQVLNVKQKRKNSSIIYLTELILFGSGSSV